MNRSTKASHSVPFARPSLGAAEEEAVLRVMRSGWLTSGTEAAAFEHEFAELAGVEHAVALSSATAGLHLGLEALGVAEGDLVAMSPYTFAATAEVTRYLGAHPVFVDIDPETLNIDPRGVEELVQRAAAGRGHKLSRLRAVMPVHIGGLPCRLAEIRSILDTATGDRIHMIEDAAHVVPSPAATEKLGTIGDVGVFSFYANKPITTGEGGMLCTPDAAVAERVQTMRLHGIDRQVWDRYRSVGAGWRYEVVEAGYKYNMPDLLAALGRVQLGRAEELRLRRAEIAQFYNNAFRDLEYIQPPAGVGNSSHHLYIVRIRPHLLRISRDEYIAQLNERGVGTSVHYIPLHIMPYYRKRYGLRPQDFPHALQAFERCISLPIYPGLTDEELEYVVRVFREVGSSAYSGKSA